MKCLGQWRFLFKIHNLFCPPKHKKLPSKAAQNPPRPTVFSSASFCFVQLETVLLVTERTQYCVYGGFQQMKGNFANWDSFIVWNFLIFEVVKLCRILQFLWCKYKSIPLCGTQLSILSILTFIIVIIILIILVVISLLPFEIRLHWPQFDKFGRI